MYKLEEDPHHRAKHRPVELEDGFVRRVQIEVKGAQDPLLQQVVYLMSRADTAGKQRCFRTLSLSVATLPLLVITRLLHWILIIRKPNKDSDKKPIRSEKEPFVFHPHVVLQERQNHDHDQSKLEKRSRVFEKEKTKASLQINNTSSGRVNTSQSPLRGARSASDVDDWVTCIDPKTQRKYTPSYLPC